MMNKMKSGFFSKAKAVFAIPVVLAVFFLIADLNCDMAPNNEDGNITIDLPVISQTKQLDEQFIILTITVSENKILVNNKNVSLEQLEETLKTESEKLENNGKQTVLLEIDRNTKMSSVDAVRMALRKNQLYKIAFSSKSSVSNKTALPQKLPPLDAKLLDDEVIRKEGVSIYSINIADEQKNLLILKTELKDFINQNEKYIIKMEFSDETNYDTFITTTNAVYEAVFELRDKQALIDQGINYSELEKDKQTEIRFKFPMTLMSININRD